MLKKREFEPAEQVETIVNFIQNYFIENGTPQTKAVIGISGGKDSTIAAALLVRALGPDRVFGVLMPDNVQADIEDARKVCEILGIRSREIDIGPITHMFAAQFGQAYSKPIVATNTPARIRMAMLYAVAADIGGRVVNTGNASEKFIGYTTKYGDLAGDFALFTELTVREVYAIGDYLELPILLVHKHPSDGMSGQTDEEKTGISYDAIDDFLLEGKHPDMEIYEKMIAANKRNQHKNCIMLPHPPRTGPYLHRAEWCVDEWVF